jgi:hypothetical protein
MGASPAISHPRKNVSPLPKSLTAFWEGVGGGVSLNYKYFFICVSLCISVVKFLRPKISNAIILIHNVIQITTIS